MSGMGEMTENDKAKIEAVIKEMEDNPPRPDIMVYPKYQLAKRVEELESKNKALEKFLNYYDFMGDFECWMDDGGNVC